MPKTDSFSIDAIDPYESVTCHGYYTEITVREANLAATVDWKAKGSLTDNPISIPAGVPHTFKAPAGSTFTPNQVVGYIATVSGSMTVDQFES